MKQPEHKLRIAHEGEDPEHSNTVSELELAGMEVRQLRTWLDQMLKVEDCKPARRLLSIANRAVWAQAVEQGYKDAQEGSQSRLSPSAQSVWKNGYEFGFAMGMPEEAA